MKDTKIVTKIVGKIDLDNTTTVDEVTHIKARQPDKDGVVLDSWHRFSVNKGITKNQARALQISLGYHPLGYGFSNFDATLTITRWRCFHSCD